MGQHSHQNGDKVGGQVMSKKRCYEKALWCEPDHSLAGADIDTTVGGTVDGQVVW